MLFRNYYRCANCGGEWNDVWSAQCDDDCPHCGARHMSPYESEDVEEGSDERPP
jgi:DNA-directed RNA polymerase subunit RPC12/RpoP